MRILYVEDNPANLFLIKRVAKMGEHEVINLIDGEEALRKIELIKPDLILMDIQLAGQLTGLDVVRKLRSIGHTMPIVAVTAYAMVGDRERCLEAGCNEYLSKPLPIGRVVELLQMYQSEHTTYEAPKGQAKAPDAVDVAVPSPVLVSTPTTTAVNTPVVTEASAPVLPVSPTVLPESPDVPAPEEPATTAPTSASDVVSSSDVPPTMPSAPTAAPAPDSVSSLDVPPTMPARAPLESILTEEGPADKLIHHSSAEPSDPLKPVSGPGPASIPAIESTSQDTSHPQDTVQAQ